MKTEITLESLQAMMTNQMLWITEDGKYHHNAEIKQCTASKDNIIMHIWQPGGSSDRTLPVEMFKKLMNGERVKYNRYTYSLHDKQFPFGEEEKSDDDIKYRSS